MKQLSEFETMLVSGADNSVYELPPVTIYASDYEPYYPLTSTPIPPGGTGAGGQSTWTAEAVAWVVALLRLINQTLPYTPNLPVPTVGDLRG